MPSFYLGVLTQLNLPLDLQVSLSDEKGDVERAKRPWEILPAGHKIGTTAPLLKEMKREEVGLFREKFSGSKADRIAKAEAEANKTADKLEETKISGAS
ncbi:Probable methionine--tRNA ligase [Olea europaea subsp. europaea]|uniref:Probable methionine--tRNA ligase n=1 Tax=Olea europaea subsp. europaea TaxID=158383 RepID=A0A8S0VLG5_OLEEU|nr:Probable methionine--tRNA ligase [Olea europaea subsp. europaea]